MNTIALLLAAGLSSGADAVTETCEVPTCTLTIEEVPVKFEGRVFHVIPSECFGGGGLPLWSLDNLQGQNPPEFYVYKRPSFIQMCGPSCSELDHRGNWLHLVNYDAAVPHRIEVTSARGGGFAWTCVGGE